MKKIILEEKDPKKTVLNFLDWFIYMVGYALILLTLSLIFKKTIIIDYSFFCMWSVLAAIIIYFLNRIIKPV